MSVSQYKDGTSRYTERVILPFTMTSKWGGTMVVSVRVTGAPPLTLDCKSTLEAPHGCLTSPESQTTPDKCDPVPGGCEKMGEIPWRPWTKYE